MTGIPQRWMTVPHLRGDAASAPRPCQPRLPEGPPDSIAEVCCFLTSITIGAQEAATITLTADSRYRLLVDDVLVAVGPTKSTAGTVLTDQVDLLAQAGPGRHLLALEVLTYTPGVTGSCSVAQRGAPGALVTGRIGGTNLCDPSVWRCTRMAGRTFMQGRYTVFLGAQERVDAGACQTCWSVPGAVRVDDPRWGTAEAEPAPDLSQIPRPQPRPSGMPSTVLEPLALKGLVSCHASRTVPDSAAAEPATRAGGQTRTSAEALLSGEPLVVEPWTTLEIDLDAGELVTAFLDLVVRGGAGGRVTLLAAECYEQEPLDVPWTRSKGQRTDPRDASLYGDADVLALPEEADPDQRARLRPFWFRTLRYLRVRAETSAAPLVVESLTLVRTGYPLQVEGRFASSSPLLERLWETSVRTCLACMHETYEDCPYYEQLQYAMDALGQARFASCLSSDDLLTRRAVDAFARSGDPVGLTASRSPSVLAQTIPGFSLFWVLMVAEHLESAGDREFTSRYLGRVDSVLSWFQSALDDDGLVICPPETEETWNFVDWTTAWRARRGVPEPGPRRASVIYALMYLTALNRAAWMSRLCQRPGLAEDYTTRASLLRRAILAGPARDPGTGLFRDSDQGSPSSVHAQVWAVLSRAVEGQEATRILRQALSRPELAQCSYPMSLHLFDALRLADLDELVDWGPWESMLEQGLTTWAEDTVSLRSDCHAWGSVPIWDLSRYVLGVRPGEAGYAVTVVDPRPSTLSRASGCVPTPHGLVQVSWQQRPQGGRALTVLAPADAVVRIPGAGHTPQVETLPDRRKRLQCVLP